MKTKKMILATFAGFVVMFLLSGLWYMVLMKDYYSDQYASINRQEYMMIWLVIGYLVLALLMSLIYPIGYKGGSPAGEGLKFGILMGLIISVPMGIILYAVWNISFSPMLLDMIYGVVEKGLGGIVIGLVYGKAATSAS